MSGVRGLGVATFTPTGGSPISFKFHAPDGFKVLTRSVPTIDCTGDTDTVKTYLLGNIPDNGEFTGTLQALATALDEIKANVPSTGTFTWTSALEVGTNGTQATVTGQAGFYSIDLDAEENGLLKGPSKFKWLGDVTVSNETA